MKKFFTVLLLSVMTVCSVWAGDIVDSFAAMSEKIIDIDDKESKPRFAFVTLASDFDDEEINEYLTDALMEAVYSTGYIRIIERSKLDKILEEQKLQSSGIIDETTAKQIGKLAGVDYIVYGNVTDVENNYYVKVRVTQVQTGELCAIASDYIVPDDYLNSIEKNKADRTKEAVKLAKKEKSDQKKAMNKQYLKFYVMYDNPLMEPYFSNGGITIGNEQKNGNMIYGLNLGLLFPYSDTNKDLNYFYGCASAGARFGIVFFKANIGAKFDMTNNEDASIGILCKGEAGLELFNFLRAEYNATYIFGDNKIIQGVSLGLSKKLF